MSLATLATQYTRCTRNAARRGLNRRRAAYWRRCLARVMRRLYLYGGMTSFDWGCDVQVRMPTADDLRERRMTVDVRIFPPPAPIKIDLRIDHDGGVTLL